MTDFRINVVVDPRSAQTGLRQVEGQLGKTEGAAKRVGGALRRAFAVAGLGVGIASGITLLAGFSQEMSTVGAITRSTNSEFAALEAQAQQLGITTRFSALEAAQGMSFLARAGFEANEVLATIDDTLRLAQAGALGLGEAADIASNVLTGFRLGTDQAGRVVDVLALAANSANTNVSQLGQAMKFVAPVAAGLGVSLEESAAAAGALSNAGLQASLAGTGLRRVLSELESPSANTVNILTDMGLTQDQVAVSSVGLAQALINLRDAGVDTGLALELFGDRGGPAFEVLSTSIPDVVRMTRELQNADGTARRIADAMDDNLNGALLSVRSAFQGFFLSLGQAGVTDDLEVSLRALAGGLRFLASNADVIVSSIKAAGASFLVLRASAALLAADTTKLAASQAALATSAAAASASEVTLTLSTGGLITVQGGLAATTTAASAAAAGMVTTQAALSGATLATAGAMTTGSIATSAFAAAFTRLKIAISTNPLGFAAVAIGTVVAGIVALIPEAESATDKMKRFRGSVIDLDQAVSGLEGLRADRSVLLDIGADPQDIRANAEAQVQALQNATSSIVAQARDGAASIDFSDLIKIAPDLPQETVDTLIAQGMKARDEALAGLEGNVEQGFFDRLFGLDTVEIEQTAATAVQGNVNIAQAVGILTEQLKAQKAALDDLESPEDVDAKRIAALTKVSAALDQEAHLLGLTETARDRANRQIAIENALLEEGVKLDPQERLLLKTRLENLQALEDQAAVTAQINGPAEDLARTQVALAAAFDAGSISANQYADAMANARANAGALQNTFSGGFEAGLAQVRAGLMDISGTVSGSVVNAFNNAENALVDFVTTGELSFSKFADGLVADAARILAQQGILALLNLATGGAGGLATTALGAAGVSGFGGAKAGGGDVSPNNAFLVGEQGPELFTPEDGGSITPAGETAAAIQEASAPKAPEVNVNVEATPQVVVVDNPDRVTDMFNSGKLDQPVIEVLGRNPGSVGALT